MRASQDQGVHALGLQGRKVALGDAEDLAARGNPALDKGHEVRAGGGYHLDIGVNREKVLVRAGFDGALSADDADLAIARGGHGAAHGRVDDLHDGDIVALAGIVQEGRGGGIAGDDQHLAAAFHQLIGNILGKGPHLRDGPRPVGAVGGIALIDNGFLRQLLHYRAGHGQPADARVKDADGRRRVGHYFLPAFAGSSEVMNIPASTPPRAPKRWPCQLMPSATGSTPQISPE